LKYIGFIDNSSRPLTPYREYVNPKKSKLELASQLRKSFDDLFKADKNANTKSNQDLKGWFKTKTGVSDPVAQKIASTFKSLADYADFSKKPLEEEAKREPESKQEKVKETLTPKLPAEAFGLVYRFEIHLPDTPNVDTYRAIFRALREELLQ
jgi:hypothetical protein